MKTSATRRSSTRSRSQPDIHGIARREWRKLPCTPSNGAAPIKAKVMPDGRLSLPVELRKKHGLSGGGEVLVEDAGDAIILRTIDQVVARAQALSRKLTAGKDGASVADFLADRTRDAKSE